jgi:hypothetical protein
MPRCVGTKPDGTSCERIVGASQEYCYSHDPSRTEERKRAASRGGKRGGRRRSSSELVRLQARFEGLAARVLSGEVERGVGAVAAQLLNGARACVATRLKAIEQEDVLERLEELEQIVERQNEYRRSGAW